MKRQYDLTEVEMALRIVGCTSDAARDTPHYAVVLRAEVLRLRELTERLNAARGGLRTVTADHISAYVARQAKKKAARKLKRARRK